MLPGAVPPQEPNPDASVAWHYGDPFGEQRAAARGVAVVDRSNREVFTVSGDDRLSWLHLMISQHVTELPVGEGTEALVLDSQGRVDAHMVLSHVDDTVWLDTEPGAHATGARGGQQTLVEYLESMKFWSKVDITDVTESYAVLSLIGPSAPDALTAVGLSVPAHVYGVEGVVRRMPGSFDLLVPRDSVESWWTKLTGAGARPMGSWGYEALRVEALRPRLGVDTDDRTIPHEVNWVPVAAHVAKGCYRGQETVSKVHNIGRPPRRMLLLHLDGSADTLPSTGDPVKAGERVVGRVGTVAQHHELGPIALALVKRSIEPGTELTAGGTPAAIDPDSLPPDTPGHGREAAQRLRG